MTPEELARLLSKENQPHLKSGLDSLSDRELEVFSILAQGYSSRQIVSEFGIGLEELQTAKKSIQTKLRLKDEVQLIQFAAKHRRGI
jgi:DNA-binding CsgD family transcriptional regulator